MRFSTAQISAFAVILFSTFSSMPLLYGQNEENSTGEEENGEDQRLEDLQKGRMTAEEYAPIRIKGDTITVTARGYETTLSRTPGSIAVLEKEDIERHSAISISNSLERTAGVVKSSDSAWGSEINIRGSADNHVILMIDRARVNTATDINARFGLVDPFFIDRVEILKGPVSALYGSGNTGGVVNIFTRSGSFSALPSIEFETDLTGYTNGEGARAAAFGSYNTEYFYASGAGGYREQNEYRDGYGNTMLNSQFTAYNSFFNSGLKLNDAHSLHIKAQLHRVDDAGIPGAADAGLPSTATVSLPMTSRSLFMAEHIYEPLSGGILLMKNRIYRQSILRRARISNLPSPQSNIFEKIEPGADHHTSALKNETVFNAGNHRITAGLDLWLREISSSRTRTKNNGDTSTDSPLPDASRLNTGLVLEDDWLLSRSFTLNTGARYDFIRVENKKTYNYEDWYESAPPAFTARKVIWPASTHDEYSWHLHTGMTHRLFSDYNQKVLLSRSYRAASLEERYKYIALGGGVEKWGNPQLEPEESFFSEYSFSKDRGDFTFTTAVFQNTFRNLIAEVKTSSTRFDLVNINESRYIGGEVSTAYRFADTYRLSAELSYTEGRDLKTDDYLPGVAPLNATVAMGFKNFNHSFEISSVMQAAQQKTPDDVDASAAWARADLSYSYRLLQNDYTHRLHLHIQNLADTPYTEYLSTSRGFTFYEPGISISAGYTLEGDLVFE